jgi:hypothetical protein
MSAHPLSQDLEEKIAIDSPIDAPFFKRISPSLSAVHQNREKMSGIEVIHPEQLGDQKEGDSISELEGEVLDIDKDLDLIKQKAESSNSTLTALFILQGWVADIVLKGGSAFTQAGLPFLLGTTEDALPGLNPAIEGVRLGASFFDVTSGFFGFLYRLKILDQAEQEILKLKSLAKSLQPDQLARLKQLEKAIKYVRSQLPSERKEQILRMGRNAFSYFTFALAWFKNHPLASALTASTYTLIGGFNAALYGLFFYRAHQHLEAHRHWSKKFKAWIKMRTLSIDKTREVKPEMVDHFKNSLEGMLAKRKERRDNQIKMIKEKIASGEIKEETIRSKVKSFKHSGLESWIENLNIQRMTSATFQVELEKKLGVSLDSAIVQSIYKVALQLNKIKESNLSAQEKAIDREPLKKLLTEHLDACCEQWLKEQSQESLLSTYVDYHSVLEPTLKNSLAQMVQKKHKIETIFLKFKKFQLGTQFSVATIIFGVALTLALIALLATSVGQAALILTILSVASVAISFGLIGRGYYLAYQQRPTLTAALLKGAYFRLYGYYTLAKIQSLIEKIQNYRQNALKHKRNQLAQSIDQSPSISRTFARRTKIEAIEMSDFSQIKAEGEKKVSKAQQLREKAEALKEKLEEMTWKDFAQKAHLQVAQLTDSDSKYASFDTLETLNHALYQADFNLLSQDTKELLEEQLGIDLPALQQAMEQDPTAFKQLLRNFFNLDTVAFTKFVGEQKFTDKAI